MQKIDNTKVFILLGVFVVGISLYRFFTQYQATTPNERFEEYLADRTQTLSAEDSSKISDFYKKVGNIYHKLASDSSKVADFSNLKTTDLAADVALQLVNLNLLDYTFDGPFVSSRMSISKEEYYAQLFSPASTVADALVNLYFGEASFPFDFSHRRWHAGLLSQIQHLEKDRYLSVLCGMTYLNPKVLNESSFESGLYRGNLYVIDLSTAVVVAKTSIEARNDASLSVSKYIKGEAEKKLQENLQRTVIASVSQALEKLFSKGLPDLDLKTAGKKLQ